MPRESRRPVAARRTADAAVDPGTKAGLVERESRRSKAEILALEGRWSFLERLYARPSGFAERRSVPRSGRS